VERAPDDSSFLTGPRGNDLLVVALSANNHPRMLYYVLMATVGSVLGCFVTDWISRKGEHQMENHVSRKRLTYIENHVAKRAGWALAVASLMPPPFPFTPFVAGAAAFEYPRKKLLGIIAIARFVRFLAEGLLAIHYGPQIIAVAKSRTFEDAIIAVVIIAIGASSFST
jgi:membrane protein YqaA with SNARE-associated domain